MLLVRDEESTVQLTYAGHLLDTARYLFLRRFRIELLYRCLLPNIYNIISICISIAVFAS